MLKDRNQFRILHEFCGFYGILQIKKRGKPRNWVAIVIHTHEYIDKNEKFYYILIRGDKMAARVKPVQPTEIKDKKIALEVIEQIRKPIPASVYQRNREIAELVDKVTRKL